MSKSVIDPEHLLKNGLTAAVNPFKAMKGAWKDTRSMFGLMDTPAPDTTISDGYRERRAATAQDQLRRQRILATNAAQSLYGANDLY